MYNQIDWKKQEARVTKLIDSIVTPPLQKACERTLAKFPKASYVGVREAMGTVWIEIDNVNFHYDEAEGTFHVVGYGKGRNMRANRSIRAHRLQELADVVLDCAEFLDTFHAGFPDITAQRMQKAVNHA